MILILMMVATAVLLSSCCHWVLWLCAGLASSLSSNVMGAASQVAGLAPSVIAYGEGW
jgi:hypothetical protein